jgi:hypothetical protein
MARDAFGIANEEAQQRAEQGTPVQTGEGVDAAANYAQSHGMANGATNGVTNGTTHRPSYKPDSWIPVEEHVLGKPRRKVKVISIGCGFSGMCINTAIGNRADMEIRPQA